mmetsp:Transcript_70931/g.154102  ORF Transcript_70931/g.154102 Transcript_70931/m.154102 type:complete len:192 (-) Transcript_70931:167-742(-)|eukprot:CAMPEP_0170613976 /NCGR_PEP_ID=MMETSP0224-20130122/24555_1 /TAXON_ID=285029 /ORGANISM="Togula jolla, Strain CCCM 725" /LENGTH=191 /DNA_ID=CAMNT_0010939605 /DNA_START=48 /DNA_END=623 /DNA_ORIENTATION=-
MAFWVRLAAGLGITCGVGAALLLVLYVSLRAYALQRRRALRAKRKPKLTDVGVAGPKGAKPGVEQRKVAEAPSTEAPRRSAVRTGHGVARDQETLKREAELKRDTLHIFRRMQAAETPEDKAAFCGEAVELYDSIGSRVGSHMASITSGRIVFCNALMECGGLDELRQCHDSKHEAATELVERVVPIIFSS